MRKPGAEALIQQARELIIARKPGDALDRLRALPRPARKAYPQAAALAVRALLDQDRYLDAIDEARAGLRFHPDDADLLGQYAQACIRAGRLHDAEAACHRALRAAPSHPFVIETLAKASVLLGRTEGLADRIEPVAQQDGAHPRVLLAFAAACEAERRDADAIDAARAVALNEDLPAPFRRDAFFLLGRVRDRRGEHERAMRAAGKGNELVGTSFNRKAHRKWAQGLIAATPRGVLENAPRSGVRSDVPVFIVGMPRSGSTLVEQILSRHPGVAALGERADVAQTSQRVEALMQQGAPREQVVKSLEWEARDLLARYKRLAPAATRVIDKNLFNYARLALIRALFDGARVIHCVRNPIDTCVSCYFQYFGDSRDFTSSFENLASYYADYTTLMEHWKSALDLPILEVGYRDTVTDPEAQARRILAFLDLPWDDRVLKPEESSRPAVTASHEQVRKPIYKSSVGRWKRYGEEVAPLLDALRDEGLIE